jgi:hypothetical protein
MSPRGFTLSITFWRTSTSSPAPSNVSTNSFNTASPSGWLEHPRMIVTASDRSLSLVIDQSALGSAFRSSTISWLRKRRSLMQRHLTSAWTSALRSP